MNSATFLKQIAFAPIFLIILILMGLKLSTLLEQPNILLFLDLNTLAQLATMTLLITLTALSFIIFTAIANDLRIVIPIIVLAGFFPLFFFPPPLNYVMIIGFSVCFILGFIMVDNKLKSYLSFNPNQIFSPVTKQLTSLLIMAVCFGYFLSVSQVISKQGFEIPDSLIDASLKLTPLPTDVNIAQTDTENALQLPEITPEQISVLKQNPELLRQSGLDPKILDELDLSKKSSMDQPTTSHDLIKAAVKLQFQNTIKPYLNYIPAILAVGLLLTLKSVAAAAPLVIGPVLWLTFFILEKTGFIKFTTEMRPVKKLVIE